MATRLASKHAIKFQLNLSYSQIQSWGLFEFNIFSHL